MQLGGTGSFMDKRDVKVVDMHMMPLFPSLLID